MQVPNKYQWRISNNEVEIDKVKCFHKYINLKYSYLKYIATLKLSGMMNIKILADLYAFSQKGFLHQLQLQISQSLLY